jgi:hypothetical protein
MHLPSQPIWFDPKLPAHSQDYVEAIWLVGVVPALVLGASVASVLGAILVVVAWSVLCVVGARAFRRARSSWWSATRTPASCEPCGGTTFAPTCPSCGASLTRRSARAPGADAPHPAGEDPA